MSSEAPKTVREMLGEVFREIGLLWVTFAILDAVFMEKPRWDMMTILAGAGTAAVAVGIAIERWRKKEAT